MKIWSILRVILFGPLGIKSEPKTEAYYDNNGKLCVKSVPSAWDRAMRKLFTAFYYLQFVGLAVATIMVAVFSWNSQAYDGQRLGMFAIFLWIPIWFVISFKKDHIDIFLDTNKFIQMAFLLHGFMGILTIIYVFLFGFGYITWYEFLTPNASGADSWAVLKWFFPSLLLHECVIRSTKKYKLISMWILAIASAYAAAIMIEMFIMSLLNGLSYTEALMSTKWFYGKI